MSASDDGLTAVEQHLGDRLAALVDGELGHDARERVLSHLATCWSCKAEADAQRRLKNVFADTAPPPPSDGLLARLQGLPAAGDPPSGPFGSGNGESGGTGAGRGGGVLPPALGTRRSPLRFDCLPGGRGAGALTPTSGFRIHREHEMDRSASRGRRFAFVAASAFSLAALALGGTLNTGPLGSTVTAGERGGSAAADRTASAAAADREARRRASSTGDGTGTRGHAAASAAPVSTASVRTRPEQAAGLSGGLSAASGTRPLLAGVSAFTPSLIRPPSLPQMLPAEKRLPIGAIPGRTPLPTAVPASASATPAVSSRP